MRPEPSHPLHDEEPGNRHPRGVRRLDQRARTGPGDLLGQIRTLPKSLQNADMGRAQSAAASAGPDRDRLGGFSL